MAKEVAALQPETIAFYQAAMKAFSDGGVPFLVGGAYAFAKYTGITRHTKDFDVFVRKTDSQRALDVLSAAGYRSEMTFPHWLGKAWKGEDFVDVIFSAGNGVAVVDEHWFDRAADGVVFDTAVKLIPAEEMIWSKGFIMERERFDGADIAHVIHARGDKFDWKHLIVRFGSNWRVLFTHLLLFGFIYPASRATIPEWVMDEMMSRLRSENDNASGEDKTLCRGTLISRQQYLIDLERGLKDARLEPVGNMSREEIDHWTAAIGVID